MRGLAIRGSRDRGGEMPYACGGGGAVVLDFVFVFSGVRVGWMDACMDYGRLD